MTFEKFNNRKPKLKREKSYKDTRKAERQAKQFRQETM